MMPIVAVFQGPGFTRASYEESVRRITGGKGLHGPADWPVPGLLVHVAGESKSGFRVVDVWESADAFRRFGESLVPVLKSLGIEADPEVYDAHTFVSA